MAPWLILGWMLSLGAAGGYAYWLGGEHRADSIEARAARDEQIARMAIDTANGVAAKAIAGIRVKNTTIMGEVRRELQTNTVYRDCQHSPEQLQRINDALAGGPGPARADRSGVPASGAAR